jgi:preprotein translocase subunit SecD
MQQLKLFLIVVSLSITVPSLLAHWPSFYDEISNIGIAQSSPTDGIYLVISTHIEKPDASKIAKGTIIPYSHRFLDENSTDQPKYLVISTDEYVPLELMERPLKLREKGDRSKLMLSLTESSRNAFSEFTGEHVGGVIAIVLDGEAVTIHKIREKIEGGKVQITRCTDQACEYLFTALQDNIRK